MDDPRAVRRLNGLETLPLHGGLRLAVARRPRARVLGLAHLGDMPERYGLLIPGCGSVHTFGMRFALDVILLDRAGLPVRVAEHVGRRRFVGARGARTVVETRAGWAQPFLDAGLVEALEAAASARPDR